MYSICLLYVNTTIVQILFFYDITFLNAPYNVLHVYYMRTSPDTLFIFTLQYLLYVYIHVFTLDLFWGWTDCTVFNFACDKLLL